MAPQRDSWERTKKVQEDRERIATLACQNGRSKILNRPVTLNKKVCNTNRLFESPEY